MGIFDLFKPKEKQLVKEIRIQASEGIADPIILESMLTGRRLNLSIPGTANAYTEYNTQVWETYRKYNGWSDFGTQQTRAVIDLRTGFICGEGISVSVENKETAEFFKNVIEYNKLDGCALINAIKGSEMAGQTLFSLKPLFEEDILKVKINRYPYLKDFQYRPVYTHRILREKIKDVEVKTELGHESIGLNNFIYIRTGGDDANTYGPTTKTAIVLTDLENYDRALKDIRRLNHILARITPTFKTQTPGEATSLQEKLQEMQWKIGKAFIGSADLEYKTPGTSAHDILIMEMASTIKTINAVTGVPVHWLGYVDLMTNRSTADSMYETIKNQTANERIIWEASLYDILLKAQEVYIDNGGKLSYNKDFQVRLPLIRFEEFLSLVRGLSLAYNDGAISMEDYRNNLPAIDPLKTKTTIEQEKEAMQKEILKNPLPNNQLNKSEDEDEEEDNTSN